MLFALDLKTSLSQEVDVEKALPQKVSFHSTQAEIFLKTKQLPAYFSETKWIEKRQVVSINRKISN